MMSMDEICFQLSPLADLPKVVDTELCRFQLSVFPFSDVFQEPVIQAVRLTNVDRSSVVEQDVDARVVLDLPDVLPIELTSSNIRIWHRNREVVHL